jgi:enediyne biosynthesis protein E4
MTDARAGTRKARASARAVGLGRPLAGLALATLLVVGCRPSTTTAPEEPTGPPWFVDVTDEVGLHCVHDAGPADTYFMPQLMGSGAALFDFDSDGLLDIYLIQNGGPNSRSTNRLFRQGKDGRFTDVSSGSGLDVSGYGMGVAIGDVNNDGWPDVFLTEYGRVRLFLNNGDGKSFTDITKEAGLDHVKWATSAAFVDFDRDGWLDLVFVSYVDYDPSQPCPGQGGGRDYCHPSVFPGTAPKLYRNRGRLAGPDAPTHGVRFEDVTVRSGLAQVPGPGLGVVCADFNGDHWPDIFIANDSQANRLWINQQNGTFKEEAVQRGIAYDVMGRTQANMGVALGDVCGDGQFDILVTHLTEETHTLWKQGPRGMFRDQTAQARLAAPRYRGTGFGTVLADFDHDGALDLAVVNGRVSRGTPADLPALDTFWRPYAERNQLFANDGTGRFRDITRDNAAFCDTPSVGRGLAYGDVGNRGALDLLVTSVAGPARLYRNAVPQRGHWLVVRAFDRELKRDAYGAEITVYAGDRSRLRWVNPGSSYLCSNDPRAHFGLGAVERVERIEVVWPDGTSETFDGGAVDQHVELAKGKGPRWGRPSGPVAAGGTGGACRADWQSALQTRH